MLGAIFKQYGSSTSQVETYDNLSDVFTLYTTLSENSTLAEFRFLLDWPELKEEEKRAKFSKYACHELSFFISRRPVYSSPKIL